MCDTNLAALQNETGYLVERRGPGEAGVKPVKRKRERAKQSDKRARNQTCATSVDTRVEQSIRACERGVGKTEAWETRFVGLLRNVLSCRRKDDIPTQLPVDEGLTHESQSSEIVIDDIITDVNVLKMEDGRVEACLIIESTRIASWIQVRKEILEITRTEQYGDSNLVPVQTVCRRRAKARTQGTTRLRK